MSTNQSSFSAGAARLDVDEWFVWFEEMQYNDKVQQDIEIVSSLFLSLGLPREIINQILDLAEFWYVQSFGRKDFLNMYPGRCELDCYQAESYLYLQTGPLGTGIGVLETPIYKPRKAIFQVVSYGNDTKRCGPILHQGAYPNTGSWFEVSIFREDESWPQPVLLEPKDWERQPIFDERVPTFASHMGVDYEVQGGQAALYYASPNPSVLFTWFPRNHESPRLQRRFKVVENNGKPVWMLQTNRSCCNHGFECREVIWTDNKDVYECPGNWGYLGAGYGNKFVKSLMKGDRIGVWARAMVSVLLLGLVKC